MSSTLPQFSATTYRVRRGRLARLIKDGVVLVEAASESLDHANLYQPAANLSYLTGWQQPDALLVIRVEAGKISNEILFCRQPDNNLKRWVGQIEGPLKAKSKYGLADAQPLSNYRKQIASLLKFAPKVLVDPQTSNKLLGMVTGLWPHSNFKQLMDYRPYLAQLRVVKTKQEIQLIKRACAITVKSLQQASKQIAPKVNEMQIAAALGATYIAAGGRHAFLPIVASGRNATVLHYTDNSATLNSNKLVLIDTGCSYQGYCADITRCYPINGKFTKAQRQLYETVLASQRAALAQIKPGSTLRKAQQAAKTVLTKGLRKLGILGASKNNQLSDFYMHGIGHWIGLEVHDQGPYATDNNRPIKLKAGMCLTIEPGLYLDARKTIPAELRNIGIRIEDTVVVEKHGCQVLTANAPKTVAEIEAQLAR